jgi:hypothetical protein
LPGNEIEFLLKPDEASERFEILVHCGNRAFIP